ESPKLGKWSSETCFALRKMEIYRDRSYENRKMRIMKIIGKASCLTRKTTGEPSWLTERITMELEAPPIKEASSVVYFCMNFLISNFSVSCFRYNNFRFLSDN
ncbi:hypothetical protein KAU34_10545, partial [candidate division WOR-3 bacterium]|nr:hypothetical protein [candidate division WOR-3 bacterium]